MRSLILTALIVAAFAIGGASASSSATAAAPSKPPRACSRALAEAEQIMDLDNQAERYAGAFFSTIKDASSSGNTACSFLATLTAAADDLTAHINGLMPQKQALQAKYLTDSAKCRR